MEKQNLKSKPKYIINDWGRINNYKSNKEVVRLQSVEGGYQLLQQNILNGFNPKYYIKLGQKILKKGGYFFITATPKLCSIAADIFKERWIVHSPESHVMHFTERHIDNLFIKEAYVGKGIVMKRYRPRARGRAGEIKKPFANLTIIVSEKKQISSKEV